MSSFLKVWSGPDLKLNNIWVHEFESSCIWCSIFKIEIYLKVRYSIVVYFCVLLYKIIDLDSIGVSVNLFYSIVLMAIYLVSWKSLNQTITRAFFIYGLNHLPLFICLLQLCALTFFIYLIIITNNTDRWSSIFYA